MSLKYITAPKKFRRYISIGALMVFGAVATGFQFWNVLNSYTVRSSSMQPTLLVGDQIVVESLGEVPPKRGEIILFSQPNNGNSTQKTTDLLRMKRIIAIAGDTIELKNNQIFLNDVPIQQETKEETTLLTGRCYPYKFFQYQEELDGIQYSILITSASLSSNYAHMEKKNRSQGSRVCTWRQPRQFC